MKRTRNEVPTVKGGQLRLLLCIGPLLIIVSSLFDLYWYFDDPVSYPIPWEGGGWRYDSHWNYVVSSVSWITLAAILLMFHLRKAGPAFQMFGWVGCFLITGWMVLHFLWSVLALIGWTIGAQIPAPIY